MEKQAAALDYIIKQGLNVAQTDKYVDKIIKGNIQKKKPIIRIKDIRIFTNTINKAVSIMKTAGFAASVQQNIDENTAEYRIIIPFKPHTAKKEKTATKKMKLQTEFDNNLLLTTKKHRGKSLCFFVPRGTFI